MTGRGRVDILARMTTTDDDRTSRVRISAQVHPAIILEVRRIAAEEGRSQSNTIERLLISALNSRARGVTRD